MGYYITRSELQENLKEWHDIEFRSAKSQIDKGVELDDVDYDLFYYESPSFQVLVNFDSFWTKRLPEGWSKIIADAGIKLTNDIKDYAEKVERRRRREEEEDADILDI